MFSNAARTPTARGYAVSSKTDKQNLVQIFLQSTETGKLAVCAVSGAAIFLRGASENEAAADHFAMLSIIGVRLKKKFYLSRPTEVPTVWWPVRFAEFLLPLVMNWQ